MVVNTNNFQEKTKTHQAENTAHGHNEVYPVSDFDYEQRKASPRRGSLPVFNANFVTAKWSVNSDVNVPDTKNKNVKTCLSLLEKPEVYSTVLHCDS